LEDVKAIVQKYKSSTNHLICHRWVSQCMLYTLNYWIWWCWYVCLLIVMTLRVQLWNIPRHQTCENCSNHRLQREQHDIARYSFIAARRWASSFPIASNRA
jgi:hypothetical protein